MSLRYATIVAAGMITMLQAADAADRAVVLVAGKSCTIETLSALDVRKAYLGIGVRHNGVGVRALRLGNDVQLNQIFFQSVVAMSEKTYERRLLLLLVKFGRPRPQEFDSALEVAAAIARLPCSIAYMWRSDAEKQTGIKAIKTLWQEN